MAVKSSGFVPRCRRPEVLDQTQEKAPRRFPQNVGKCYHRGSHLTALSGVEVMMVIFTAKML